jgi:hypothetical protein
VTRIQVKVPKGLARVDRRMRDKLLSGALRQVAAAQLKEKEKELREAERKLASFERKYGKELNAFERSFPVRASVQMHEDLVEWSFWRDAWEKSRQVVEDLRFCLGQD